MIVLIIIMLKNNNGNNKDLIHIRNPHFMKWNQNLHFFPELKDPPIIICFLN